MGTKIHPVCQIRSQAPTRIDLAGGTLDIWPIYLFLKRPTTLNLAIDLYAETELEIRPPTGGGGQIILQSNDQKGELHLPWNALEQEEDQEQGQGQEQKSGAVPPNLILHYKLLKHFYLQRKKNNLFAPCDLKLSTRAQSPAGAGLGGSSSLSISLIGALATWARMARVQSAGTAHDAMTMIIDPSREGESFIEIVRDIETTVIQIPAGLQDYYAAMYGGLQCLQWGTGTHERTRLPDDLISELESRVLLFYSGQSRNSGINNWAMFKAFIDKQGDIPRRFELISSATRRLESALLARDWENVGTAIAQEWATRKTLADGITLPEIDQAFAEVQKLTPLSVSGKVCGAGGGGCFFVYLPFKDSQGSTQSAQRTQDSRSKNQELKSQIESIFVKHGMRPLKFRGSPQGLKVQTS